MRTILTFLGAYVFSLIVALYIGIQLADFFRAEEEFVAVIVAQVLFSLVAITTFAVVYRFTKNARGLGLAASGLGVVAVFLEELPALIEVIASRSTYPYRVGTAQDIAIAAELVIPIFVMLLIQWRLLRWRWLAARELNHRSTWPSITITVALIIGLNRLSFEILSSAIRQDNDDMLAQFWLKVSLAVGSALIAAGLYEWSARRRRLARAAA